MAECSKFEGLQCFRKCKAGKAGRSIEVRQGRLGDPGEVQERYGKSAQQESANRDGCLRQERSRPKI